MDPGRVSSNNSKYPITPDFYVTVVCGQPYGLVPAISWFPTRIYVILMSYVGSQIVFYTTL
jgi:hypothetical protein